MITKDMKISEILQVKPDSADILLKNGMGCIGCPASQMETLEQAAMVHGMSVETLLKELNA